MKKINAFVLIILLSLLSPLWARRKADKNFRCLKKYRKMTVCIGEKVSTLPRKNMQTKKLAFYRYGIVKRVYRDRRLGNYALIFWKNGKKEKLSFKKFYTAKEVKQLKLKARGNIKRIKMLPRF